MAYTPILGSEKAQPTNNLTKLFPIPYQPIGNMSQTTQAISDASTPSTLGVLKSVGQGLVRIPIEATLTAQNALLDPISNATGNYQATRQREQPLPTGSASWALGKAPLQDYGTQILDMAKTIRNSPTAKKYGISKYSLPIAFVAGISLDTLNFIGGGEGDGAKTFLGLMRKIPDTAEGIVDAGNLMRTVGFSEDTTKQYAPLFASESTAKGTDDIANAAVKLQNTTKETGVSLKTSEPLTFDQAYTKASELASKTKNKQEKRLIYKDMWQSLRNREYTPVLGTPDQTRTGIPSLEPKTPNPLADGSISKHNTINGDIQKILSGKTDNVSGALYNNSIGKIDLYKGEYNATTKKGFGLIKIEATHPEVLPFIDKAIKDAKIVEVSNARKILESGGTNPMRIIIDHQVGVNGKIENKTFLNNAYFIKKVPRAGIEPATPSVSSLRSASELTRQSKETLSKPFAKVNPSKLPTQTTTVGKQTQRVIKDVTGKKVTPFVRKRETTLLKERIRNVQKGFREGTLSTKQDVKTAQSQLTGMIKNSNLEAKDKTKFLSSIKNVQTSDQLKKILPTIQKRIKTLEDTATHNTLLSQIKNELNTPLTRKVGSTNVSKYSPETTKLLKEYHTNVSYKNPENAITQLRLKKLEVTSQWHIDHPNEYMPDNVINKLEESNRKHLPLLSNDELAQELQNIQSLKTQGKTFQRITKELATQQREKVVNGMNDIISGGKPIEVKPIVPESNVLIKRTGSEIKKFHLSMLNSDTLFDTLDESAKGNLNAGKINDYFQNVTNKATDVKIIGNNNDLTQVQELLKKNNIGKEVYDKVSFKVGDKVIKMDRKAMIDVYISSFDKAKLASMIEGNKLPQKTIDEIISKLTPNEKAFGKDLLNEIYAKGYDAQNAVYRKVNFMDMPKNEGYSRMYKDMRYVQNEEINSAKDNLAYAKASVQKGMTKARTGSLAPIKLDAIDNVVNYLSEKNHYIAWELPIREMNSVMKGISKNVTDKYGTEYISVMNDWLKRVAGDGRYDTSSLGRALLGVRRGVTKSLITNFITPLKQTISLSSFLTEMSGKDLASGMTDYWAHKAKWDEFWNKVPQIQNRSETLTRDIGAISKNRSSFKKLLGQKQLTEVGVAPVRFFDRLTVRSGATAMYNKSLKEGLTEEEALAKTLGTVRRTQITGDIKDLSAIQSGGALEKLLTMFQNQPNKYYNIIYQNIRGYAKGRVGKVALGKALLYSWIVPAIAYEEFSTGGTAKPEDLMKAILFGPFIDVLVLGNIASSIKSGYNYTASPVEELPNEFIKGMQNLEKGEVLKSIGSMLKIGAQVGGLPVNQPKRTYEGLKDITSGNTSDWRRLIWSKYALGEKNPTKPKQIHMQIPTGLPSLNSVSLPKLPTLPSLPKL